MGEESHNQPDRRSIWMRVLYMLLFAIIYSVAEVVVVIVAAIHAHGGRLSGCDRRGSFPVLFDAAAGRETRSGGR